MKSLLSIIILFSSLSWSGANSDEYSKDTVIKCCDEKSIDNGENEVFACQNFSYNNKKLIRLSSNFSPYSIQPDLLIDGKDYDIFITPDKVLDYDFYRVFVLQEDLKLMNVLDTYDKELNEIKSTKELSCKIVDNNKYLIAMNKNQSKLKKNEQEKNCKSYGSEIQSYYEKLISDFKNENENIYSKIRNELDTQLLAYSGTSINDLTILKDNKASEYKTLYDQLDRKYEEKFQIHRCGSNFNFSSYQYKGFVGDDYLKMIILIDSTAYEIAKNNIKDRSQSNIDSDNKITDLEIELKRLEKELSNKTNNKCYRESPAWEYWKDKKCKTKQCKDNQIKELRSQLSKCSGYGKSDEDILFENVGKVLRGIF